MFRAMRMLHTSDWHLGRSLHRADLRAAQAAFLDHLVDVVRAEKVDVVLVAGDVYDRAVPPVDAVQMCEDALLRLHDTGARIVLISGNHDSARRLGFGSALLDKAGVHLRTQANSRPVLLGDAHGPVAVYGAPYAEPGVLGDEILAIQADADARGVRRPDPRKARRSARDRVPRPRRALKKGVTIRSCRSRPEGPPSVRSDATERLGAREREGRSHQ